MALKIGNGLDLQNQRIVNVGSPSSATDAVNKSYVDAKITGLHWKQAVRAATTAAGTLSTSFADGQTIDGVELEVGDRILIKNQANAAENGIYVVTEDTPVRAEDADSAAELESATVFVAEGDTLANTAWTQTADDIDLDTTGLVWAQFGAGGGSSYTFGDGLVEAGGQVDLKLDGSTLTKSANGLRIGSGAAGDGLTESSGVLAVNTGTGLEVSSDAVRIATSAAGDGLTGGGSSALSVNTGDGLTIDDGAVAVNVGDGLTISGGALAVDSGIARKVAFTVGGSTEITVTHDLGTEDVQVEVYEISTKATVLCDVVRVSTSQVKLTFANAPSASSLRVVVTG